MDDYVDQQKKEIRDKQRIKKEIMGKQRRDSPDPDLLDINEEIAKLEEMNEKERREKEETDDPFEMIIEEEKA